MNYRYRSPVIASHKVKSLAEKHIPKVGLVIGITGKRFTSERRNGGNLLITDHEVVTVTGTKGTARFSGVCWGYGGEGPHALRTLLIIAGVPKDIAERIAFAAPRNDSDGIDWHFNALALKLDEYTRASSKKESFFEVNYRMPVRLRA